MNTPAIARKKLTRRSFFKHGLRLSALAFMGFGFTGRNNLATERITLSFPNPRLSLAHRRPAGDHPPHPGAEARSPIGLCAIAPLAGWEARKLGSNNQKSF